MASTFSVSSFWWNKLFFVPLAFEPHIVEKRKKYLKGHFPLGSFCYFVGWVLVCFKLCFHQPKKMCDLADRCSSHSYGYPR